jgi:ketosteroid isomerase-like protein
LYTVDKSRIVFDHAKAFFDGQNAGDLNAALKYFREDASYYGLAIDGGTIHRELHANREAIYAYLSPWAESVQNGVNYSIESHTEYGDALLVHWKNTASADGLSDYSNHGILLFEFDDEGLIQHARSYQDMRPIQEWFAQVRQGQ